MNKLFIYTFYRFVLVENKNEIKKKFDLLLGNKFIRGTILLSEEGINGSISASKKDLDDVITQIKLLLKIKKLEIKKNEVKFLPFNKIKVKIKKEIVSLGQDNIKIKNTGKKISPKNWDKIVNDKNISLIDTRNQFEIKIGSFKNSINPETNNFREFPKNFSKLKIDKDSTIAMFCTGGIRCEKASAYLKKIGYKNVFQLDGGILNYLDYKNTQKIKNTKWKGDCFVFDNRVTVKKNLKKGKYIQCYGCRHPITESETKLKSYKKGVSCKYCYKKRSKIQMERSITRQKQINQFEKLGIDHPFAKIS